MKIIIIGGGKVGSYLATLLLNDGHDITLIEQSEKVYQLLLSDFSDHILIHGNGSEPEILEKAGIKFTSVVAVVTDADEVNLAVSTLAKMEFGVPRVVARVNNPKNQWLFNSQMGVDIALNQADLMAHFVVEELNMKDMFTMLHFGQGEYAITQLTVTKNANAINQLIKQLPIPKETVLIAITRNNALLIPNGDTIILENDVILTFTDKKNQSIMNTLFC